MNRRPEVRSLATAPRTRSLIVGRAAASPPPRTPCGSPRTRPHPAACPDGPPAGNPPTTFPQVSGGAGGTRTRDPGIMSSPDEVDHGLYKPLCPHHDQLWHPCSRRFTAFRTTDGTTSAIEKPGPIMADRREARFQCPMRLCSTRDHRAFKLARHFVQNAAGCPARSFEWVAPPNESSDRMLAQCEKKSRGAATATDPPRLMISTAPHLRSGTRSECRIGSPP